MICRVVRLRGGIIEVNINRGETVKSILSHLNINTRGVKGLYVNGEKAKLQTAIVMDKSIICLVPRRVL